MIPYTVIACKFRTKTKKKVLNVGKSKHGAFRLVCKAIAAARVTKERCRHGPERCLSGVERGQGKATRPRKENHHLLEETPQ